MGVDSEFGNAALRLWIAAGAAALLVAASVLTAIRLKSTAFERATFVVIAAALGAVVTWSFIVRPAANDHDSDRRTLELRAGELTAHALAPGSALPCLDAVAGSEIEAACEKSLFASPAAVAAATSYVTSRLSLLTDIVAYVKRGGGGIDATFVPLRRAVEADRYGFLAHALAVRDGCTEQTCSALAVLKDDSHVRDNLSASTFDTYLNRYLAAWNAPADVPVADAAATQPGLGPGAPHKIVNIDFPSAASIPAVSIMSPEPAGKPAAAAAATPASEATGAPPKKPRKQAANSPAPSPPPPPAVPVDPVWQPAPSASQAAAAPAATAAPSGPMQLMPQSSAQ